MKRGLPSIYSAMDEGIEKLDNIKKYFNDDALLPAD